MLMKNKTFDCVEMKHKAQQQLHDEYEIRRNEFSSYYAFLESRSCESPWQRELLAKVDQTPSRAAR